MSRLNRAPFCVLAASIAIVLGGCAQRSPGPVPPSGVLPGQFGGVRPDVSQRGNGSQWKQFTPKASGSVWDNIVAGPDGNMWYTDENASGLVRITMDGAVKEYSLPAGPYDLTVGADKRFYINDTGTTIIRTDTHGSSSTFSIPSGDSTQLDGIATGPDGNVWFTEYNHVGKIDTKGKITEYPYPTQPGVNTYGGITAGPDGNMWFAESTNNAIGVIKPSTGKITEYPIPQECSPAPIVSPSDGNLWFACLLTVRTVGSATTHGAITLYQLGGTGGGGNYTQQFGAVGPDGLPWFASADGGIVYSVDTTSHMPTDYSPPPGTQRPNGLATGPDGNIWITMLPPNHVEVLILNILKVKPDSLTFPTLGTKQALTVSQPGTKIWTAKSSDTTIATVKQGAKANQFIVQSVGSGKCSVTISDAIANSAKIPVTVQ
jgi:virginiamycin B lyase